MLAAPVIMHTYIISIAGSMPAMCSVGVSPEARQYITSGTRAKVYIHLYIVAVLKCLGSRVVVAVHSPPINIETMAIPLPDIWLRLCFSSPKKNMVIIIPKAVNTVLRRR